jgi:hypothetical protein
MAAPRAARRRCRAVVTSFDSLAAVLPTRDVNDALHRYRRLGFDVSPFRDGREHGYARRDNVNLHLAQVDDLNPSASLVATYSYVGNADDVHAESTDAGVEGRLVAPVKPTTPARGRIRRARRQPAALRITHPAIDSDPASTS